MKEITRKIIGLASLLFFLLLTVSPITFFAQGKDYFKTVANYEIIDGEVVFSFELINRHTKTQNLVFSSGQQFEIVVSDSDGNEVYRYSDGKAFTMALIYRSLRPDESFQWQDKWDLKNKDGKALLPGQYIAEIRIMVVPEGQVYEDIQDQLVQRIEINFDAQSIIENTSDLVMEVIKNKDAKGLAQFVHPTKGVRFTPYTHVSLKQDLVFDQEGIENFFSDETKYHWGYYDGSGMDILLTPAQYYDKFIYTHDFINAEQIGYNEILSFGNMVENQFEVYDQPIVVEYYFSGFKPEYAGIDWRSLRLVFEQYGASWKLVGIIYNQWTI